MSMKILVTGGSGFVWKRLIARLLELFPWVEIDNLSTTAVEGTRHVRLGHSELFDFSSLSSDYDYVVHTLALSSDRYCEDFLLTEKMNVSFTRDVLEFCRKQTSLKKFAHFSSIVVYDNANVPPVPETGKLSPFYGNYSFTKGVAEQYVEYYSVRYGIPSLTLRFSNMYGPGQAFVNSPFLIPEKIYQGLHEGKIVAQTDVPVRDFLYVDDAIEAIRSLMFSSSAWVFNVAGGEGVSIGEVVREIADQLGVPHSFSGGVPRGPTHFFADVSKLEQATGWKPQVSLREGIRRTIESYSKTF